MWHQHAKNDNKPRICKVPALLLALTPDLERQRSAARTVLPHVQLLDASAASDRGKCPLLSLVAQAFSLAFRLHLLLVRFPLVFVQRVLVVSPLLRGFSVTSVFSPVPFTAAQLALVLRLITLILFRHNLLALLRIVCPSLPLAVLHHRLVLISVTASTIAAIIVDTMCSTALRTGVLKVFFCRAGSSLWAPSRPLIRHRSESALYFSRHSPHDRHSLQLVHLDHAFHLLLLLHPFLRQHLKLRLD